LDAILASGQSGRITLNIGGGGNVRIEMARFRDVPVKGEGLGVKGSPESETQRR
jgi:hypothetical protein